MANYDMPIYDKTRELAELLKGSALYAEYSEARQRVIEKGETKALLDQYHRLQMQAQAGLLAGKQEAGTMEQLQKLGELLQFDQDASRYLMAEYQLGKLLGDVYRILGEAVDIDLRGLEG